MFSKRSRISSLAFFALGACALDAHSQTAAEGEPIYSRRCASCHRSGSPVGAPDLGSRVSYSFARFSSEVRTGRDLPEPQTDMPAFLRAALPDRDLCAVYLYVRAGRSDAAGESSTVCGFKPPPAPGKDPGGEGGPSTPPAPPDPALEASRRHFAPARGTTYRLECRGGDSAAAVMLAGSDGGTSDHPAWRYSLGFLESRADSALRPAFCKWIGPAPATGGASAYRLELEWNSALAPSFQTISYRAVDNAIRVDSGRRLLYPELYRDLVEAVSRPDATFAFEVWSLTPRSAAIRTELRVSAAAVRRGPGR